MCQIKNVSLKDIKNGDTPSIDVSPYLFVLCELG